VRTIGLRTLCMSVVILGSLPALSTQQPPEPAPAPVPSQILAAQKVFISNAGGSFETPFSIAVFDGGPDRTYNEFYAAMKSWGRYEVVLSPADADMVLEVRCEFSDSASGSLPIAEKLRLVVIDPKTNITLWSFTQYVQFAGQLRNRDKNFDQAVNTIVNRLKILATPPVAHSGP